MEGVGSYDVSGAGGGPEMGTVSARMLLAA